jgi:hypothetical protein
VSADLTGVRLKLEWAKRHLADLEDSIEAVLAADGDHFASEFDPQTGQQVYQAQNLPAIKPEWSLMIGDILHNLRSALDHLAWQLVILDGGEPDEQTQFPIRETPFSEKGNFATPQLTPAIRNPEIIDALKKAQPYHGPDGEPIRPDRSPLLHLRRLNNIDKHRLLLVVARVLDSDQMWWGGSPEMAIPQLKISTAPLEEGSPVAWFDWGSAEPPDYFNPHLALTISLNEPNAIGRLRPTPIPVLKLLDTICNWVEREIMSCLFEPLFAQAHSKLPTLG